jgi:hypothetical protein
MRKSIHEIEKLKEYYIKQDKQALKVKKSLKTCACGICFKKLMEVYRPENHKLFVKIDGQKFLKSYAFTGQGRIINK